MNLTILNTEAQEYITSHLYEDPSGLLFKGSPFRDITARELVEQIESKKASEKKLPTWFQKDGIYYPLKLSIEQTSSELTAKYKADLIKGNYVLDLTGGFGVDSYFFSKKASSVTHCELNPNLSAIAKHNATVLVEDNVQFVASDGIVFLQTTNQSYDTIYIDPSRRKTDKRVFLLSDCEPNVVEHLELLLSKTSRIIIKTSPLLDIQSGLRQLKQVREIHVISIKNDCKELLWVIDEGFEGEPEIKAAAMNANRQQNFSFKISEEKEASVPQYYPPKHYLYEPDAALMKAGCFKLITEQFKVKKLNHNTHLYTSDSLNESFVGKSFEIISVVDFKTFAKNKAIVKANVISRNFPLNTGEIKKKFKVKDGGDEYLFFTSGPDNDLITIHAKRV